MKKVLLPRALALLYSCTYMYMYMLQSDSTHMQQVHVSTSRVQVHIMKKLYHVFEDGMKKSVQLITNWHHEACQMRTNGDREGLIFYYPILTRIIDYFSCSSLNTACSYWKKELSEIPEHTEMQNITMTSMSLSHNNDVTCLPTRGV